MKVLLGVCGGIAAYKAAELTRELQRRQIDVQVAMTRGAEQFITPLTFAALSNHQVLTSLWQPAVSETATGEPGSFGIEHIAIAQQIDALVIAPATANIIAKLAHGLTDDLLTTIALATTAPLLIAPAMNVNMWNHPATQQNIATLKARGVRFVSPDAGYLACGMVGDGRLAEPSQIAEAVASLLIKKTDLTGETILITAGGTREPIDPVRYIGNRSSGKMGHALAEAALARGAEVILVTTTALPTGTAKVHRVETAAEMRAAVLEHLPRANTVIMAAAVADYRVAKPAVQKTKKQANLTLELVQNNDILAEVTRQRHANTLVLGFAAETENLLSEGRRKLREKHLDAIIANDVSSPESGFDVDRNAGYFLTLNEEIELPPSSKREMADRILDQLDRVRKEAQQPLPSR